ncbi:MAG TPA: dihydroorotate dehydrogenase electron transfer subunit [Methanothermococcus okinawensis]|uniref:Probable dihydroorotate dehydrogenase B (NAD(+)), electron transfer subunit n=1 Tax=Methanothermococcus okinawensis TaxID=155863 RepID=A0A833E6J3_9EURY|nr:dihydroorotate dehydrogenase electron transfer subunit [Methanothermococcus okinawensis]HIP91510.1 dihydroorotate dehydrogenase electron transfer subunit [Methanothermococcus okinawensis]
MERPEICKIKEIVVETPTVKTFILDRKFLFRPGQFAMLWLPGVDEKPFGYSSDRSFTVAKVGRFTEAMHNLKEGDLIGVRGPYGTSFEPLGDRILGVAGGIGAVPVVTAVEEFSRKGFEVTTILGACTKEELLFVERFRRCGELILCTDDGTLGYHGFTTEMLERLLREDDKFDLIITCGPELMMKKVVEIGRRYNIPVQVSLERYMKCGIGLCGHCALDDEGLCVCKDGPVFWEDKLRYISEFGRYRRDGSGSKKLI